MSCTTSPWTSVRRWSLLADCDPDHFSPGQMEFDRIRHPTIPKYLQATHTALNQAIDPLPVYQWTRCNPRAQTSENSVRRWRDVGSERWFGWPTGRVSERRVTSSPAIPISESVTATLDCRQ